MIVVLELLGRSILNGYGFGLLETLSNGKKNDVLTWLAKSGDVSTCSNEYHCRLITIKQAQLCDNDN